MEMSPLTILSSFTFTSLLLTGGPPIVYVGWTLEWEMLFYLIFGLSLLIKSWGHIFLLVTCVLMAVSTISGDFISMEFIFGMAIAYIYNNGFKVGEKSGFSIFLIGFALLSLSLIGETEFNQSNRVIIWGIPSFFIVFGLLYTKQIKNRFLTYLGDASYSVYLVQILTIPAFYKVSSVVLLPINSDILSLMCLVCSVLAGCLMFSFVEKPMTLVMKRFFLRARAH